MKYAKAVITTFLSVALSFAVALMMVKLDALLGFKNYSSVAFSIIGSVFLITGIVFRIWASLTFYNHSIAVLRLKAQKSLVITGPYKISRNPLYIGLVANFAGAVLIVGSLSGLALAVLQFIFWDLWIKFFEERNLEKNLGEPYKNYKKTVPRWFRL